MFKYFLLICGVFLVDAKNADNAQRDGCSISIANLNGVRPVYIKGTALLVPSGTSGNYVFTAGEKVILACPGSHLMLPGMEEHPEVATLECVEGNIFVSSDWYPVAMDFNDITCACVGRTVPRRLTTLCNAVTGVTVVYLEVIANGVTYPVATSCFNLATARTEYVSHPLLATSIVTFDSNIEPAFQQGALFPNLSPEVLYLRGSQMLNMDEILGTGVGSIYFENGNFLSKGMLAGKSNFVQVHQQLTTFSYTNVAPLWLSINEGNWKALERSLKQRVAELGSTTQVYSGTHGILQIADTIGGLRNIYLNATSNMISVPQYFYKVIVEAATQKATAFVIINNPKISMIEAERLTFCADYCGGSPAFRWVQWDYTNVTAGYSFCCDLKDFQKTVTILASLTSTSLFS